MGGIYILFPLMLLSFRDYAAAAAGDLNRNKWSLFPERFPLALVLVPTNSSGKYLAKHLFLLEVN